MLKPTKEEIEQFLVRMGKHGLITLSTLGKLQPFAECMETELGKALLGEPIIRYEELLNRLAEPDVTVDEQAEFRVIKKMLLDFASKINQYNNRVDVIKMKANVRLGH